MNFLIGFLLALEVFICFLLIVVVLMQPSKADSGVGSAFGGQATDSLFGANSPTILAKFTAWLTVIFFALTFLLAILIARRAHAPSLAEKQLKATRPEVMAPIPEKPKTTAVPPVVKAPIPENPETKAVPPAAATEALEKAESLAPNAEPTKAPSPAPAVSHEKPKTSTVP